MKKPIFQRIIDRLKIDPVTKCWNWTGVLYRDGYGKITLSHKNHPQPQRVHRLIYPYFYGSIPEDKPLVLHHCDNPKCCNPLHLYAGTHQDNINDRLKRNPHSWPVGEKHRCAKFTEKQVLEIRASKEPQVVIAKRLNVWPSAIWKIKHRKTWKHV